MPNIVDLKRTPAQGGTGFAAGVPPEAVCRLQPTPTHLECGELVDQCIADRLDLRGDDRQHGGIDPVKLIEAAPRATLGEAREDLPDSLGIPSGWSGFVIPRNGGGGGVGRRLALLAVLRGWEH